MNRLSKHAMIRIGWISLFAVAMAFLESSVVVYLREIYYPGGFKFPLVEIPLSIASTEILRELATLIMLSAVAYLAGKNAQQRFAWFLWCFGLWDIFYYAFLKALIGWPASIMTWDILFLIPVTWVGPVIAPVIVSLLLMGMAVCILFYNDWINARLNRLEWASLIVGSSIIIVSFIMDYVYFWLDHVALTGEAFPFRDTDTLLSITSLYVPEQFHWSIFITGCAVIVAGIVHFVYRCNRIRHRLITAQLF